MISSLIVIGMTIILLYYYLTMKKSMDSPKVTIKSISPKKEVDFKEPPIIVDRKLDITLYNRNYGHGDPIRGDLAITPNTGDWFATSANPVLTLRKGALHHLIDLKRNCEMNDLLNCYSKASHFSQSGIISKYNKD
ncbi:hypothetical protein LDVICp073 [lymphocystis disease virus-China]|uniref:Uncharacterized protein n=2 Tax=Lymphocystis disease virus 2 TaxID=159183 RepID=A0A6F8WZN3_9VIRU|nr:hypothetical protein LDVICp073 [lymphocystis disease virus-China]AAU10919.1 hypothetical protein [lymphocystis disease virus-China]BCB67457.1 hypothetical protein [Lymphocystis disease virus 2]